MQCEDCIKKECSGCKYQKNRFKVMRMWGEKCIFDSETEEIYLEDDLDNLCNLLNHLNHVKS